MHVQSAGSLTQSEESLMQSAESLMQSAESLMQSAESLMQCAVSGAGCKGKHQRIWGPPRPPRALAGIADPGRKKTPGI